MNGAECELTDAKSRKWYVPSTLGNANVHRGDGPMSVICAKTGFRNGHLMVDETIAGATLGNILIGGGVGILVDAIPGSTQRYPDQITVWMGPESCGSESERLSWLKEKEKFDAEITEKKRAVQGTTQTPIGK